MKAKDVFMAVPILILVAALAYTAYQAGSVFFLVFGIVVAGVFSFAWLCLAIDYFSERFRK